MIWFRRLWITVCPEGPGAFSLKIDTHPCLGLTSQVVPGPLFPSGLLLARGCFQHLRHTSDHSLSHLGKEPLTLLYPYSPARARVFVLPAPPPQLTLHILTFGLWSVSGSHWPGLPTPDSQLLSCLYPTAHIPGLEPDKSFSCCFGKVASLSILGVLLRKDTSLEY